MFPNLRQPAKASSSDLSAQSFAPSHLQLLGIQLPFLQVNLFDGQRGEGVADALTVKKKKGAVYNCMYLTATVIT